MKYYLISRSSTKKNDKFITFWRPYNRGYTRYVDEAGLYDISEERSINDIYIKVISNNVINGLMTVDKCTGKAVIKNTKKNREFLGL